MNVTFTELIKSFSSAFRSKKKKQVLSNLNGNFRAGNLTAIMGPSGAGKSTLMNILAGFTTSGVSGKICVNGHQRNLAEFRRSSVYIMQEDNLQPLLTVLEAMHFAADLKLENSCDNRHKVQRILKDIGLESVHDTRTKNLSGGQKKRLAIALELISNPGIIFLDEPTNGLDSVTSHQCFELLKSFAREGRNVVCNLHQPSAILFEMIDHLYVIGDGQCVYAGSPKNVVAHLADLGFRCPIYHNPADYLLEVVSGEYGDHIKELAAASTSINNDGQQSFTELSQCTNYVTPYQNSFYTCSAWTQIRTLIKCNIIKLSRDSALTYIRLIISFLIALLTGILFYGIGQDAAYSLDNFNMLFFTVLYLMFVSLNTTLIAFPLELPVLKREYFNRWYDLHWYYLANRIVDLPLQLFAAFIYLIVIYCMSGQLMEYERLGLFLLTNFLVSLNAQTIGLIVGASFDVQTAAIAGPFAVVPTIIFSGFFVRLNHAHPSLRWLFHLSFCKYGFDGVMFATYGLDRMRLKCSESYCHYASPNVILNDFGAKNLDYWFSVWVLAGLYIFLNFVAYLALQIKLKMQTR